MPCRSRACGHRPGQRVGARQFQPEDPAAVHAQRRTAVEQQRGGDVAATGQQLAEHARLGRLAGPQIDVVADVLVDVEIGTVFEAVGHRAVGVLLEPLPKVGGRRLRFADAGVARLLEHRDVVGHEALRPRVPLRIGNPGPVLRRDVDVVVLRPTRRRQVRIADAAVAADGDRVRPRHALLRGGPGHPAELRRSLSTSPFGAVYAAGKPAEQRMHRSSVAGCWAISIARVSIVLASMSPSAISRSGSTRPNSGISPGQRDAIQPSATPASTMVRARSSRADSSLSRYSASRSFDGEH